MKKNEITVKQADSLFDQMAHQLARVRQRAFELFKGRDQSLEAQLDDWLQAERELCLDPGIEMREKDGTLEIDAPLPGMDARDVKVQATRAELLITATHEDATPPKADDAVSRSSATEMCGVVHFPYPIDPSTVTADLHAGHLRVKATLLRPEVRSVEVRA